MFNSKFFFCVIFVTQLFATSPSLFLLKTFKEDMNVTGWVMSEKYDGVRAYWNGKDLISRSGKIFTAPRRFTQNFPPFELDGELWTKRGGFEKIVSIVNTKDSGERWMGLRYMVFEVPHQEGSFFERLDILKSYLQASPQTYIKIIKQIKIKNNEEVKAYFIKLTHLGAEGIVIRNPDLAYYTGRKKDALKYKPFIDAECRVLEIIEGKGKYKGMLGALKCDFNGKIIKIGSGFTDKERKVSLAIGSLISFKYYGLTRLGNPKYPVFLRLREEN